MPRPKSFVPEEVLDKAMVLFWQKGFEATSVQDLVDHMGINRFSLYSTFGDKQRLFLSALDRYRDQVTLAAIRTLEEPDGGLDAIRRFFESLIQFHCTQQEPVRGCLMVNTAVELAPHSDTVSIKVQAHRELLEGELLRQLTVARQRGEIAADANLAGLATYLTTSIFGLAVLAKSSPEPGALEAFGRTVLAALDHTPIEA